MQLGKDVILAIIKDTLDDEAQSRLRADQLDKIVETCFTRLGGSGLVRWVPCLHGEPELPGHGPFGATLIEEEDLGAAHRIIERTVEAYASGSAGFC